MYVDVVINTPLQHRFTYSVPEDFSVQVGLRVIIPFRNREITGFIVECKEEIEAVEYEIKSVKRVVDEKPLFGDKEIKLAQWIASFYLCSEGEALSAMIPSARREVEFNHLPADESYRAFADEQLSDEQRRTINSILSSANNLHYIYGVTGSGKSEVFLQVADAVIAKGKEVIYLVPEITLTHQLAQLVARRYENRVAILHSRMSSSQRFMAWKKIKAGEVDMVIGARSAVFAPFENLGLIIIDEEHENSYKAGNTPRYHARQVAQRRASVTDSLLLMGSATPSLESFHMMQEGKIERHLLTKRVAGGKEPHFTVVNMLGQKHVLSKTLRSEMKRTLDSKKQVILFLNRRGFSYYFHCNSCGFEMSCPHCSVSLTFHKNKKRMICHYCGYSRPPMTSCPTCKSMDVGYGGFGTEMVQQEVSQFFPEAVVERLDTDSAQDRKSVKKILNRFKEGEIDILLGTQMVAKGLNFPLVDLVGIVLADSGLNLPDFRSQERTFSLIVQVSGRTGRFNEEGKVVVQTFNPDNLAIRMATQNNLEQFYQQELSFRKATNFPPYTRLVNFVIRGKNREKCSDAIVKLKQLVDQTVGRIKTKNALLDVLGHSSCPIEKIADSWRFHLVVRSTDISKVLYIATVVHQNFKVASGLYLEIDIDPLSML
jgi:primosomal protein N' (replication factor Y)